MSSTFSSEAMFYPMLSEGGTTAPVSAWPEPASLAASGSAGGASCTLITGGSIAPRLDCGKLGSFMFKVSGA